MTAAAGLLLVGAAAFGADFHGQGRLWIGPGFDSNAPRDFTSPRVSTEPDFFLYALGNIEGALLGDGRRLAGAYDIAGRKFLLLPSEDTLVESAQLEGLQRLSKSFSVGLAGHARDRRGAERDYTDLVGEGLLDFVPDEKVSVRLRGGAHRFLFWKRFGYSFFGADFSLSAQYRFNRRHSVMLFANLNPRTYNATAVPNPKDDMPPDPAPSRKDTFIVAGLTYSYRGPFFVSVGYSYLDESSNSYGETMRRHRFSATGAVKVPFDITLLGTATLQLTQYPDGVYLSPELQVVEDDENSSSATLKLVRPIAKFVDLDVRYALYVNVLPQNNFLYLRHVASIGLAFSF